MKQIPAIDLLFEVSLLTVNGIADQLRVPAEYVYYYLLLRYPKQRLTDRGVLVLKALDADQPLEVHPEWGAISYSSGYKRVRKPSWYTGSPNSRHVALHTLIMCKHIGVTCLDKKYVIVHADGNKLNNELSNLLLLTRTSAAYHYRTKRSATYRDNALDGNALTERTNAQLDPLTPDVGHCTPHTDSPSAS